jgi:GTP-binding protein
MGENGIPFAIVFTKIDKLSHSRLNENTSLYKDKLLETWEELPPVFCTSSEHKQGKEELLNYIENINKSL